MRIIQYLIVIFLIISIGESFAGEPYNFDANVPPSTSSFPFYLNFSGYKRITALDRDFGLASDGRPSGWYVSNSIKMRYVGAKDSSGKCRVIDYYYVAINEEEYKIATRPLDSDADGLVDEYDPCPDILDTDLDIGRSENKCTGEWY